MLASAHERKGNKDPDPKFVLELTSLSHFRTQIKPYSEPCPYPISVVNNGKFGVAVGGEVLTERMKASLTSRCLSNADNANQPSSG